MSEDAMEGRYVCCGKLPFAGHAHDCPDTPPVSAPDAKGETGVPDVAKVQCRNHPHHCPGCGREIECGYVCCATCTPSLTGVTPAPSPRRPEGEPLLIAELRDEISIHDNPNLRDDWGPQMLAAWDDLTARLARAEQERDEARAEIAKWKDLRTTLEMPDAIS